MKTVLLMARNAASGVYETSFALARRVAANRALVQTLCIAFCLALALNGGAVFATQPASCTGLDLTDNDASANMLGAARCVLDSVGITTFIIGLVLLFVPIFFLMWGFKAGVGLIKQLASSAIRMLRG